MYCSFYFRPYFYHKSDSVLNNLPISRPFFAPNSSAILNSVSCFCPNSTCNVFLIVSLSCYTKFHFLSYFCPIIFLFFLYFFPYSFSIFHRLSLFRLFFAILLYSPYFPRKWSDFPRFRREILVFCYFPNIFLFFFLIFSLFFLNFLNFS